MLRISNYTKVFIALLLVGMGIYFYVLNNSNEKVTTAYIPIWKDINEEQLEHVDIANIAFAYLNKNEIYFHKDEAVNNQLKEKIKKLKANHPKTKFVLGVGGYGVDGFSDAVLDENRNEFTDNIIKMVKELGVDGVEIDWEYPGFDAWDTQKARAEDTENFTSLMKELREKLNRLPHKNKDYLLSFAAGTEEWYFENVEVKEVEKYVDYINVMSYDLTGRWSKTTGYNANLYADSANKTTHSVDQVMNRYLEHGIDSEKILLGIPAYSYGWTGVKSDNKGLFIEGDPINIDKVDISYKEIVEKYMKKKGFKRYYDNKAKAAYLYNGDTFITYEDKQALEAKVNYIKEHNLGGAMVWEYSHDAEDGIITYLSEHLNK